MFVQQLMAFTVRFLIAAPAVFFFVGWDLDLGAATVPVGLVGCMLLVPLLSLLEPRFQHVVRIDSNRRIYVNGIPYYRLVLATIGAVLLMVIVIWLTPGLTWRSFFHLSH